METLVTLLCNILVAIVSLLPNSPFLVMINQIEEVPILGIINWFIPFDNCLLMLEIWASAVALYYIVKNIDKIIDKFSKIKGLF